MFGMNRNDEAILLMVFLLGMIPAIVSCIDLYIQGRKEDSRVPNAE